MKSFKHLATFAFALLALVSCGKKDSTDGSADSERVEKVRVLTLKEETITREINLSTILQGYETRNVSPSVTGIIEKIYVEEGDHVQAGQNIVQMDQMQYKTAQLQFANLGVDLNRVETLLKSGSATQQQYDQLKLAYDQTKENLDFLEKNIYYKAPFSAVVSAKNYEDGELYNGAPILTLTQISTLKAEVAIPESYFPLVKKGTNVTIHSDIYPGRTFVGTVEVIFPTVDPASHTFIAKVKINNASGELRPGMYTSVSLGLGEVDAILAPYQAVLKLQGSNDRYVFVNNKGTARRVAVTLGQRFDDRTEIFSDDIHEGDELVVVGQGRLVDGVKLDIQK